MAFAKKTKAPDPNAPVADQLIPIELETIYLRLVGDTPLICNAWSEKARNMMRQKQQKTGLKAHKAKSPEEDFRASLYVHHVDEATKQTVYGFKTVAFKAAAVTALSQCDGGLTKVRARGAFHIGDAGSAAELVPIESPSAPTMREDPVRVATGTADLRYRGEFWPWAVTLKVRFNRRSVSAAQLVSLFNLAGFACGIGDWRPEKDGINGQFHVEPAIGEDNIVVLEAIRASARQIGHSLDEQPERAA